MAVPPFGHRRIADSDRSDCVCRGCAVSALTSTPNLVSGADSELARELVVLAGCSAAAWAGLHAALETTFTGAEADEFTTAVGVRDARSGELRRRFFPRSSARLIVCSSGAALLTPRGRGNRQIWRLSSCGWSVTEALAWASRSEGGPALLAGLPVRRDGDVLVTDVAPLVGAWLSAVDPFPVGTRVRWRDTWAYPERDVDATVTGRSQSYTAGDHDWYLRTDDGEEACASWRDLAPEGWGTGRSGRADA